MAAKHASHSRGSSRQVIDTPQGQVVRVRKKSRRRKRRKWPIVVLVIVALLACAGVAVAKYLHDLQGSIAYEGDAAQELVAVDDEQQEPFYVLVIGSDAREDWETARSDVMLLVRVDLTKPQVTLVSVPRDTPYYVNGTKMKLNEVYRRHGEAACVKAVSEVTGVDVNHFARVEFEQVEAVVDAMGGIVVDVPYGFQANGEVIEQGQHMLTGAQALELSRNRKVYDGMTDIPGDVIRQANVRAVFTAMVQNVLDSPTAEIPGRVQELASMVKTDIPVSDLVAWALQVARSGHGLTVYSVTGPTAGEEDEEGVWYAYDAPEQWAALMAAVDAGDDPTEIAKAYEEATYADDTLDVSTSTQVSTEGSAEAQEDGGGE